MIAIFYPKDGLPEVLIVQNEKELRNQREIHEPENGRFEVLGVDDDPTQAVLVAHLLEVIDQLGGGEAAEDLLTILLRKGMEIEAGKGDTI